MQLGRKVGTSGDLLGTALGQKEALIGIEDGINDGSNDGIWDG